MLSDELARLKQLYEEGALSDEEYAEAKAIAMRSGGEASSFGEQTDDIYGMTTNTWCMMMHLSQFCVYAGVGFGIVVPIIMWAMSKDKSADADNHGRVIMNWLISGTIYGIISGILVVALIGIPMLIILVILSVVFPIIGALRANESILWRYPLSITFFGINQPRDHYGDGGEQEYDPFAHNNQGY